MLFGDYTNDAICAAMGLGRFIPAGPVSAMRVLLKPSFHPEVCITLEPERIHVLALKSMLWHEPFPHRMLEYWQISQLASNIYDDFIAESEHVAEALANRKKRSLFLDGMPVAIARVVEGRPKDVITGNAAAAELTPLIVEIVRIAHEHVTLTALQKALAECGAYVDQKFATDK